MHSKTYTQEELATVLLKMGIDDAVSVEKYGSGHINETFKVETRAHGRFILQRVNTDIFDVGLLKENVIRVTEHLAAKNVKSLEVAGYENPWRLYKFLEGYKSYDIVETPRQAYDVGVAFAKFQSDLADLGEPRLKEIIPDFHNTPERVRQLDNAMAVNYCSRLGDAKDELHFAEKYRKSASLIVNMMKRGEIPERVTHNDTKINNVLIAPDDSTVVIDLDTVMPGSALYDFGDMVRTATAASAEDERDLSRVYSKKDCFEALAEGYIRNAGFLTECEMRHLVFAGKLMTFEVGIRFLADFLVGDEYFHTAYPEHNLIRARNQFKMVQSIEEQSEEYERIVQRIVASVKRER